MTSRDREIQLALAAGHIPFSTFKRSTPIQRGGKVYTDLLAKMWTTDSWDELIRLHKQMHEVT